MTSMSLFQAKNILGFKMKRSIINFCNGEDSTSTLNQQHFNTSVFDTSQSVSSHNRRSNAVINETPQLPKRKVTLEEMIMQLELEEENARKEKLKDIIMQQPGRRSCVNNSDILRSARNALNQYPRFSLDGRDAMYRNFNHHISPVKGKNNLESDKRMPSSLGGERVVWCKPGVVARLMGLEAIPVPVLARRFCSKEKLRSMMKRQSLWQMAERHENERRKNIVMEMVGCRPRRSVGMSNGSCSRNGEYCVINPVAVVQQSDANFQGALPMRRYK